MPSPLEIIAVGFGIANIALLVRRSIWNYPVGIVMVALYFEIFREARLYSDMLLQIFFLILQLVGWFAWLRSGGLSGPVSVTRMRPHERWLWPVGVAVATLLWGTAMARYTDAAAPWWDAAVAMGSIAAQILLAQRRLENWIAWIMVDIVAIALYAHRGLTLTAALYVLFLGMCIVGWLQWRRAERGVMAH
ncbi:MAG: nicotinamide riboside transporter PnuC [Sphingopyxis sp.]|nr:nicotinamide riboside transporter PnuC [Sphingopyxis sp.]